MITRHGQEQVGTGLASASAETRRSCAGTRITDGDLWQRELPARFHALRVPTRCPYLPDELGHGLVKTIEHVVDRQRWSREVSGLQAERIVNLDRCAFVKIAEKGIGMNNLDTDGLARGGRKVAEVRRNDAIRVVRGHRRGKHVAVARIVRHRRLKRGNGRLGNRRILKRALHRLEQVPGLLRSCPTILDQLVGDLIEDSLAPTDSEHVLLSDPQQRVPQRKRIQHAGIKHDRDEHIRTIWTAPDANRYL